MDLSGVPSILGYREYFSTNLSLLSKYEANQLAGFNGFAIRVTREDSTNYMVTMDLRFDRINLQIDNGVVTSCNIG